MSDKSDIDRQLGRARALATPGMYDRDAVRKATAALETVLAGMPTPLEQAHADFNFLMQHGTPAQKETVMVILRLCVNLKPGAHTIETVEHATEMLHRALS